MKNGKEIRSMFASISRRYDLLNHLLSLNQDKRWRRKAVEMSGIGEGARVLDVCTGTADLAVAYSKKMGDSGVVIGTDFCPEMLQIGKQKLVRGSGTGRVSLTIADTLTLPFADEAFDVVSVAFGIRNVSDLKAGISEMARVTKQDGRVVILEFSLPENRLVNAAYMAYFTRLLPIVGRLVSRARNDAYSYLPGSVVEFPSNDEMRLIMQECGLSGISAKRLTLGIVTLYVGKKLLAARSSSDRRDTDCCANGEMTGAKTGQLHG